MLVVLASEHDREAKALVSRWAAQRATLLTPGDLSVPGWRHYVGRSGRSTAVIAGEIANLREVTGVLTRLPMVFEEELNWIVPEDRSFVAAEMTAFLLVWLSGLTCPVVNRPTATCLSGPGWSQERWVQAAVRLGVRSSALSRCSKPTECRTPESTSERVTVTVVGKRCFGVAGGMLAEQARRLARWAKTDLLSIQFSKIEGTAYFTGANVLPDLTFDGVADAVLDYLLERTIV